ncbi:MAG TPA: hypothetical protein PKY19_05635 [Oscillospiraceae bacterium]|nr:hypothetical protein [Oscillospiraceae bacterium]HXK77943.1 hypothetical protein [Oscillospiraceae bacterium]
MSACPAWIGPRRFFFLPDVAKLYAKGIFYIAFSHCGGGWKRLFIRRGTGFQFIEMLIIGFSVFAAWIMPTEKNIGENKGCGPDAFVGQLGSEGDPATIFSGKGAPKSPNGKVCAAGEAIVRAGR